MYNRSCRWSNTVFHPQVTITEVRLAIVATHSRRFTALGNIRTDAFSLVTRCHYTTLKLSTSLECTRIYESRNVKLKLLIIHQSGSVGSVGWTLTSLLCERLLVQASAGTTLRVLKYQIRRSYLCSKNVCKLLDLRRGSDNHVKWLFHLFERR